jgi:hypothetical protein
MDEILAAVTKPIFFVIDLELTLLLGINLAFCGRKTEPFTHASTSTAFTALSGII